jgi:hypothetical protein
MRKKEPREPCPGAAPSLPPSLPLPPVPSSRTHLSASLSQQNPILQPCFWLNRKPFLRLIHLAQQRSYPTPSCLYLSLSSHQAAR